MAYSPLRFHLPIIDRQDVKPRFLSEQGKYCRGAGGKLRAIKRGEGKDTITLRILSKVQNDMLSLSHGISVTRRTMRDGTKISEKKEPLPHRKATVA